ncbi:MAG TPA: DUF4245 domain-containing protein [Microbacterium sp.]|nr:DUF4245 domain-containing protein [Microbacterium sp.]
MSKNAPIVAELGRAETPEETAARKAEFSKNYRASQNFRNLIAALIVTVAVVAIVIFAVPRGQRVPEPEIDMAGIAQQVESSMDRPVLVPELSDFWRVNDAQLEGGATTVWKITLAPAADDERGFLKIAQAFDTDSTWAPPVLNGFAATDTVSIDGIVWDVYDLPASTDNNVTYAVGTQTGDDYVLLYGARSADSTAKFAESLTPQLEEIEEAK